MIDKKEIEKLISKESLEKIEKAKKERGRKEEELKQYEKQLGNKRKNLANFINNVYESELVQNYLEFKKSVLVYKFGLLGLGSRLVFLKNNPFLKDDIYLLPGFLGSDFELKFNEGYVESKKRFAYYDKESKPIYGYTLKYDLAEMVETPKKFVQKVLKNIKKQLEDF